MSFTRTVTSAAVLALVGAGLTAGQAGAVTSGTTASPCDGYRLCRIVSKTDVDGDGRGDLTGMTTYKRADGTGTATLRVLTASGRSMTTKTEINHFAGQTFYGAAKMDGQAGYELVVMTDMGAHTPWFRAVTYRNGRLVTLVDPEGQYRWTVDSAVWIGKGYKRTVTSTGEVRMTSYVALDNTPVGDRRYDLTTKQAAWRNGRWERVSTTKRVVGPDAAYRYADWYVPYLPKFYG